MTRVRPWLAVGGIGLFLAALCTVPYRFPLQPSVSDSYFFGYNNRIAEIIVIVGAVLLACFGPDVRPAPSGGKGLTKSLLYWWLAVTLLVAGTLQLFAHRVDGFGEGIYLVDRVKLAYAGERPYFQFEYPYGAFFLYGPVWLARILHISPGDGYAIFWVLNCVAGTWLLYRTLSLLDIPQGKQRAVFIFFSSYGLFMMGAGGVNYTLFRYVPSCFFAVLLYGMSCRPGAGQGFWAMLLAVPCTAFLLVLSPELAISFAAGVVIYFAIWGRLRESRNLLGYAGLLAGLAGVGLLAARLGVFITMQTYSTGAYNLPVILGPHVLLFFTALGISACYVGSCLRRREQSALLILVCTSAVGLAGALGRCDRVHTLMNPFGIVLTAALLQTSSLWLNRLWWWGVWFVFIWMLMPKAFSELAGTFGKLALQDYMAAGMEGRWPSIDRLVAHRIVAELGPELGQRKLANMRALAKTHGVFDVNQTFGLPAGTVSEAPFGFTPSRFGTFQTPEVDEGYYFEHQNMGIPAAVERKIAEMRSHPERPLLLLTDRERTCLLLPDVQRGLMRQLFTFPYSAPAKNPVSVTEPLCAFIRDNYRRTQAPTPEHFDYVVWQHK